MQGWEGTHGYGYMALGCSVTNNRAGAYVGPVLHTDDRTYTLTIKIDTPFKNCLGFSRYDYPSEDNKISADQLTYIRQADPFHSDSNIWRGGMMEWGGCSKY